MEEPTCSRFALLSSKIGNYDFDLSETQENKLAEEPLSISARPLYEPTITRNPSSSNEYQDQVFSCSTFSWKYVKTYDQLQQPLTFEDLAF